MNLPNLRWTSMQANALAASNVDILEHLRRAADGAPEPLADQVQVALHDARALAERVATLNRHIQTLQPEPRPAA